MPRVRKHGTIRMYNNWGCRCKPCKKASADYRKLHPRPKGYAKQYAAKTGCSRRAARKRSGCEDVSESHCIQLLHSQKNRCAICRIELIWPNKNTHIDHSHQTGRIRGVLCTTCNTGLGCFKDNPRLMRKAIEYVEL